MRFWKLATTWWIAAVCVGSTPVLMQAEVTPEVVRRGKRAAALVEIDGRRLASAFCVNRDGVFITSQHVVARLTDSSRLRLILNSGETDERVVEAKALRIDKERDLAILAASDMGKKSGVGDVGVLELGDDDGLIETTEVLAFGFPKDGEIVASFDSNPSVTVSTGRVTSLRKIKGKLQLIQIDASLRPGNSGGAVLGPDGRVIGVVKAGVLGTQVCVAVPVGMLRQFAGPPTVSLKLPRIPREGRFGEFEFSATVLPLMPATDGDKWKVDLMLGKPEIGGAIAMARDEGGRYVARAKPFVSASARTMVGVKATLIEGAFEGMVVDAKLRVGPSEILLSELSGIDQTPEGGGATARDGRKIAGMISEPAEFEVNLGKSSVKIPLRDVRRMVIQEVIEPATKVEYELQVKDGKGAVLEKLTGTLYTEVEVSAVGLPTGPGQPLRPPLLDKNPTIVELPAAIDDAALAGGGRYLVLRFPKLSKLGIFDVSKAKLSHYIDLPAEEETFFAAGLQKLVLVHNRQKVIQRWDLASGEREASAAWPFEHNARSVTMGSASSGPVLAQWATGTGLKDATHFALFDLGSLKPVESGSPTVIGGFGGALHIRASAGGDAFGMWRTQVSPQGVYTATVRNSRLAIAYAHEGAGVVKAGPDGRKFFTSGGGIYNAQAKLTSKGDPNFIVFPSEEEGLYAALPALGSHQWKVASAESVIGNCFINGRPEPIAKLPDLRELREAMLWKSNGEDLTLDKRLFWLPSINLLVTIPESDNRLMLRKFNVFTVAGDSGVDYIVVTSVPPTEVEAGSIYSYQIATRSRDGGVRCTRESGPEGLAVSPLGLVTWDVPKNAPEGNQTVVVSVKEQTGTGLLHPFDVYVRSVKQAALKDKK